MDARGRRWMVAMGLAMMVAVAVMIVFSLPRIMSDAHWMTDVVVGAGSIACVVLSWMLLTPASDKIIAWFEKKLPLRWFQRSRNASKT